MVAVRKKHACSLVLLVSLACALLLALMPFVRAQEVTYSVNREWTKVWINADGSMNILYNITFSYLSGSPQGLFDVGMPKGGFQIGYAEDLSGQSLQYRDISQGNFYAVEVTLKKPVILNQPITFVVYATVTGMVYPDSTNAGNYGVQFFPSTFPSAIGSIGDLRLEIVLPPGVQTGEVRSPAGLLFDRVFADAADNNRTAVYWQRTSWSQNLAFEAGVSFPEKYVSLSPGFLPDMLVVVAVLVFVVLVVVAGAVLAIRGGLVKAAYESPRISIEALGANRSLTAVEAGLVMGLKPARVLTMMLYGLLLKRMAAVVEREPLIKLEKLEKPEGESASAPRYYEIDFLQAIKPDGTLDEKALARTYQGLVDNVNQRLRGYSRDDTVKYYKSIVDKAWTQVTQAGTPELKGDALDKNLDWLLADENFDDRLKTAFPPTVIIYPNPAWWWYWGSPRTPSRLPSQTQQPSAPTKTAPLPGQDFANNVVLGLQSTSNNLVKDMQAFANKLVPFQATSGEGSVSGKPSCVCACHACACACACVSCACACAGGGGH